jgi:hypothetical protein
VEHSYYVFGGFAFEIWASDRMSSGISRSFSAPTEKFWNSARTAPRRYPYFNVVVGFVWSHDPKSYAGGSVCYW